MAASIRTGEEYILHYIYNKGENYRLNGNQIHGIYSMTIWVYQAQTHYTIHIQTDSLPSPYTGRHRGVAGSIRTGKG